MEKREDLAVTAFDRLQLEWRGDALPASAWVEPGQNDSGCRVDLARPTTPVTSPAFVRGLALDLGHCVHHLQAYGMSWSVEQALGLRPRSYTCASAHAELPASRAARQLTAVASRSPL